MKILLLTPQVPYPPHQGATIRNYTILRFLAQRHTVDLLTFLAPGERLPAGSPLYSLCRRIGTAPQPTRSVAARLRDLFFSPRPDMALRLESQEMHKLAAAWMDDGSYDIVQVEGIEMAQYALSHAKQQSERRAAIVFDDHNCEYLLQYRNALTDLRQPQRWHAAAYSLVQWRKLQGYEAAICRRAAATIAVSDADKAALERLDGRLTVTVISNGIDLAGHPPAPPEAGRDSAILVFTGKMDYRPNIDAALWFAHEVLPAIVASVPNVRFQIVGSNPHKRLDALRTLPNVEITGAVPSTLPYIHNASVYVIPLRVGGGTRFKALEAMSSAKPIVSTSLGVEGIAVRSGQELLLADTPEETTRAVLDLLADQRAGGALSRSLGEAARRFVSQHYAWEQILPQLEQLYATLIH
jgi:sugar transferase (PEP-CTERM/EpsH1 system associated)